MIPMAFFGIGKKSPPKPDQAGKAEATVKVVKTGKATKSATVAKPKARVDGGEPNIYTGVLAAAAIALLVGCILIAMDNLSGVTGTTEEGNPFAVISSR